MSDIDYSTKELSKLKYVKITYTDNENTPIEIQTDVKILGEKMITLFFREKEPFDIQYPQQIIIKFVTENGLFIAISVLQEVRRNDGFVYLIIPAPAKMIQRQKRKYFRVNMKRSCVLIANKENGQGIAFLSRLVDISAGGVLIHKLESMFNDDYIAIDPDDYKSYNIVLFLDIDVVLKLSARFVRYEEAEESYRYAFEFTNMKQNDIDTISKYVTKEQLEQIKQKRQQEDKA